MDCQNPTRDFFANELMKLKDGEMPPQESKNLFDYVARLREERRKIEAFKRELPLCFDLLNNAVERLEVELRKGRRDVESNLGKGGGLSEKYGVEDMKNWMSSVQLWNYHGSESHDLKPVIEEESVANEVKRSEVSIMKSLDEQFVHKKPMVVPVVETNQKCPYGENVSLCKGNILVDELKVNKKIQRWSPQPVCRKRRRCWSHELHQRFVDALQELGGSEVATPKQIRDIMRVEDLTNDEVKSHLQKYRLHIRKGPSQSSFSPTSTASQDNQFSKFNSKLSHSVSPLGPLDILASSAKYTASNDTTMIEEDEEEETEGHSSHLQNRIIYRPSLPTC